MNTMTNTPLVDVIIPVYNGERYLHEAIESVLKQRYHPLQLIVVDDGSEDESAALAARFEGVHVLHGPHAGIGAALNRGIRHGKGDLIAFLDADDRWLPEKLARQVKCLQAHPGVDMVFGYTSVSRRSRYQRSRYQRWLTACLCKASGGSPLCGPGLACSI
ncbi:MAG: glycosyltransferase family A protein [Caldilineaceae bacterium]